MHLRSGSTLLPLNGASPALLPVNRVALLVDGENMPQDHAQALLSEAARYGAPTVRRVYGKAEHLTGWDTLGYRPVPTRPGKNAADLLLCVEAMSFALRDAFHTILIASSDRDFTYVATHLRELGHEVVGLGEAKAPAEFRAACSVFVELVRVIPIKTVPKPVGAATERVPQSVGERAEAWILREVTKSDQIRGILIAHLGQELRKDLGLSARDFGHGSLGTYLRTRPDLFECDARGPEATVRLRRAPPAAA